MKTAVYCFITALSGLAVGLLISFALSSPPQDLPAPSVVERNREFSQSESLPAATDEESAALKLQKELVDCSYQVLYACQRQDYATLSELVHPDKGVTFTPYSTVSEANLTFTAASLRQAAQDGTVYIWGVVDGSNLPIQLTIFSYFDRYVCDRNYNQSVYLGIDRVISAGNSLENVAEAYPDGHFVEFYYPGVKDDSTGVDWRGLKLVFEEYLSDYRLVGASFTASGPFNQAQEQTAKVVTAGERPDIPPESARPPPHPLSLSAFCRGYPCR